MLYNAKARAPTIDDVWRRLDVLETTQNSSMSSIRCVAACMPYVPAPARSLSGARFPVVVVLVLVHVLALQGCEVLDWGGCLAGFHEIKCLQGRQVLQ
mmetsp:Transcript_31237/g.58233  ORF Transcript_31237/g.58233 Transcript_31237/m.58233 type:complete len:98 (+) Transcript_31237:68-361(+)